MDELVMSEDFTVNEFLEEMLNAKNQSEKDVIGDINARRGRMEGMDGNDGMQEIHSFVPLSEMFGYATDLRSKTQGRGTYTMEPSHYEEVPKSVFDAIVASRAKKD